MRFNWTAVDKIYDILVEHNICPIVETLFIPHCIQKSPEFWYIPKDYKMWAEIIKKFVIHVQERYGKEEVENWYFEIWNEPDNREAWVEDPRTFFALYDYMEHAIYSVNPNLKVGGPATKQWNEGYDMFRAFLDHCAHGLNYVTGEFGTRLDFISVHCKGGYPRSTYNPSTGVMFNSVEKYIDIIKKEYPQFTPLNKYPSTDLIKKPVFNAYVLLSKLGTQRLSVKCDQEGFGRKFGVLPTKAEDVLSVMVWNFEDGMADDVNDRSIKLNIEHIQEEGKYRLVHYRIDGNHSNAYNIWSELGRPYDPSLDEIKKMRQREGLELYQPVKEIDLDDNMELELHMPMHSVSLLLFLPLSTKKPHTPSGLSARYEEGFNKNPQVFLKWNPNEEKDFLYYKIWRREQSREDYELISDNTSVNTAVYVDMDVEIGSSYVYKIQAVNASMICSDFSDTISVKV